STSLVSHISTLSIHDALPISIFTQIYGQGESPMTITAMRKELIADRDGLNWSARIASVGTAQSCIEVRVVDQNFRDLPFGQSGRSEEHTSEPSHVKNSYAVFC